MIIPNVNMTESRVETREQVTLMIYDCCQHGQTDNNHEKGIIAAMTMMSIKNDEMAMMAMVRRDFDSRRSKTRRRSELNSTQSRQQSLVIRVIGNRTKNQNEQI